MVHTHAQALIRAAAKDHTNSVRLLLDAGADKMTVDRVRRVGFACGPY